MGEGEEPREPRANLFIVEDNVFIENGKSAVVGPVEVEFLGWKVFDRGGDDELCVASLVVDGLQTELLENDIFMFPDHHRVARLGTREEPDLLEVVVYLQRESWHAERGD